MDLTRVLNWLVFLEHIINYEEEDYILFNEGFVSEAFTLNT